jgi:hypothetical protein
MTANFAPWTFVKIRFAPTKIPVVIPTRSVMTKTYAQTIIAMMENASTILPG